MNYHGNFPGKSDQRPSLGRPGWAARLWRKANEAPPWLPWGWVWWAAGVLVGAGVMFALAWLLGWWAL